MNSLICKLCLFPSGLNSLHSSTGTVAPVSSLNAVGINNTSNPSAIRSVYEYNTTHNGFIPGHLSGALDTKFTLSATHNNPELYEERTPSLRSESAESSTASSESFTVHSMLKESTAKPFASSSQTFTVDALLRDTLDEKTDLLMFAS